MNDNEYKNLFKNIKTNFNEQKNKIKKSLDLNKSYEYIFSNENGLPIVDIIDENKNSILKAKYNVVGIYNVITSIWHWGWNVMFINRKLIKYKSLIQKFPDNIKKKYSLFNKNDQKNIERLYFYLKNDNFFSSSVDITHIMQFILYITKSKWYIPIKHRNQSIEDENNTTPLMHIEYILLDEIIKYK
jgi:hypothetical protein